MNRLNRYGDRSHALDTTPVVSIMSGKGGVGKSVIAFNLAECLATRGYKTLLIDADRYRGNLHILANQTCEYGLAEFASGQLSLAEAKLTIGENLDLLAATCRTSQKCEHDGLQAARMISDLRSQSAAYDLAIIDHPSGAGPAMTVIGHASNLNLLVLIPELTSIADAYGLYKELVTAHRRIDCRLLANWVADETEAAYLQDKFSSMTQRFLGQSPRLLGWLPSDPEIRQAVAAQAPLRHVSVAGRALQAFDNLAQDLARTLSLSPFRGFNRPSSSINDLAETADIRN
ncbi:MAG: AAA family ATPase [bacterium]